MDIQIIYEDSDMVAINKPAGVIVNRADTVKVETIQDWAEKLYFASINHEEIQETEKEFYSRAGIVHRIDKETTGILLLAKNNNAFLELQRQFKEREIKKTYVAIVHGKLVPEDGEINAPVGRLPWNRERFGVVPGGKEALTAYHTVKTFSVDQEVLTLVELYPHTGRTHQIRVHMKYINHPLLGDYLYAGRKTSRDDRLWAERVMLHAQDLTCFQPSTHETLAIHAPMPDDMNTVLKNGV
jgi:23S rRNA pseudouridine1911/1915/1917 synthase